MVDCLQKKESAVRNTPEKVMNQTYLKTASVAVKVSPTAKSLDIMTASVEQLVTTATYGKDKKVYPYQSPFEVVTIMSINRRNLNGYKFSNRYTAPILYDIVDEIILLDAIGWGNTKISYIANGNYEWIAKRKPHLIT